MSITITPTRPDGSLFEEREVVTDRPCQPCAEGWCQPGWCEDGRAIDWICDAPLCNVANDNARPLLATVGIDAGPCLTGAIEPAEVAGILAECTTALGLDVDGLIRRAPMLTESADFRAGRGARVILQGTDDARARDRLERLHKVLCWAHENGAGLAWS